MDATPERAQKRLPLPRSDSPKIADRRSNRSDLDLHMPYFSSQAMKSLLCTNYRPIDSRKVSPLGSVGILERGRRSLSSRGMGSTMLPKNLTFVASSSLPPHPFFPPEKAHLLNLSKKKLMNSEGYPQARWAEIRTSASRKISPQWLADLLAATRHATKCPPKILTLICPNQRRKNFSTFDFQAFAVSECQLAPEKAHLGT